MAARPHGRHSVKAQALFRRAAALALALAGLVFVALTVRENWAELRAYEWEVSPARLTAATLLLVVVLGYGVYVWGRVMACFEAGDARLAALLRIWFVSNLARYIPGKIWQFVGAAQMAQHHGYSPPLLLTSLFVHAALNVASAALVAGATLPFFELDLGTDLTWLAPAALIAAVALLHPRVIERALRLVPRALHRDVLRWRGRWRDGLRLLALATLSWIFYGAAFYLFVSAITPANARIILPLTGANALSFLAGYLVIVVPAGVGVGELALALLLRPFAPPGVAAVVALTSRLWIIAAEVIGAAIMLAVRGRDVSGAPPNG